MPNSRFPVIPGRKGWPVIGDAISFFRDTLAFQRRCYENFGPVFYTRLGPESQVMLARRNLRAFEFMGHEIPANSMVVVPNLLNMRLEKYFPDPDTFDPERFAPGREEHKRHSFAWVPFGGGAHKCIGLHFAEMLVKIVLFELLRTSDIRSTSELVSPVGGFAYVPFPKPRNDLPLEVIPRPATGS